LPRPESDEGDEKKLSSAEIQEVHKVRKSRRAKLMQIELQKAEEKYLDWKSKQEEQIELGQYALNELIKFPKKHPKHFVKKSDSESYNGHIHGRGFTSQEEEESCRKENIPGPRGKLDGDLKRVIFGQNQREKKLPSSHEWESREKRNNEYIPYRFTQGKPDKVYALPFNEATIDAIWRSRGLKPVFFDDTMLPDKNAIQKKQQHDNEKKSRDREPIRRFKPDKLNLSRVLVHEPVRPTVEHPVASREELRSEKERSRSELDQQESLTTDLSSIDEARENYITNKDMRPSSTSADTHLAQRSLLSYFSLSNSRQICPVKLTRNRKQKGLKTIHIPNLSMESLKSVEQREKTRAIDKKEKMLLLNEKRKISKIVDTIIFEQREAEEKALGNRRDKASK